MIFDSEAIMGVLPVREQKAFTRTIYRADVDGKRRAPMLQAVCDACDWEGNRRVKGSRTPMWQLIEHNREHHTIGDHP